MAINNVKLLRRDGRSGRSPYRCRNAKGRDGPFGLEIYRRRFDINGREEERGRMPGSRTRSIARGWAGPLTHSKEREALQLSMNLVAVVVPIGKVMVMTGTSPDATADGTNQIRSDPRQRTGTPSEVRRGKGKGRGLLIADQLGRVIESPSSWLDSTMASARSKGTETIRFVAGFSISNVTRWKRRCPAEKKITIRQKTATKLLYNTSPMKRRVKKKKSRQRRKTGREKELKLMDDERRQRVRRQNSHFLLLVVCCSTEEERPTAIAFLLLGRKIHHPFSLVCRERKSAVERDRNTPHILPYRRVRRP